MFAGIPLWHTTEDKETTPINKENATTAATAK